MTNRILRQLRGDPKFRKQEQPPAPALDSSMLSNALGELIRQAAQAGAEAAVERQPVQKQAPAPKPRTIQEQFDAPPLSNEFPPPPPRTAPPKDLTVHLQRNEVGRVHKISIGKTNFIVQRDSEGRAMRLVQEET